MSYQDEYQASIENPEQFWAEKASQLDWYQPASQVLTQDEHGIYRWFADGELNTCHLALDYHVDNGRGDQVALIYDSPVTNQQRKFTLPARAWVRFTRSCSAVLHRPSSRCASTTRPRKCC